MEIVAVVVAVALALIGLLHVVWIFSPWPLPDRASFAELVTDRPVAQAPPWPLTLLVAVLLGLAGYLVVGRAGVVAVPGPAWLTTVGAGGVAAVLLLRGVGGFVHWARSTTAFARLNRRWYSPLCVVLGTGAGVVALVGS
ncbi:hypothetical protein GCM10022243_57680 [Saccharothrix violaceirubra]|uniref:DUF3995 domain-containing protein n=1 Tax=Saccharothrix violaceirubra TaxID=413306 RepID=A0A7W7T3B3_9PSEU|nr:DUF3995 domain-containing protein [Saccharothrix violaceirubra]MBB4965800.1 hypothetical protein [Saccharothrix violaceirubra]